MDTQNKSKMGWWIVGAVVIILIIGAWMWSASSAVPPSTQIPQSEVPASEYGPVGTTSPQISNRPATSSDDHTMLIKDSNSMTSTSTY